MAGPTLTYVRQEDGGDWPVRIRKEYLAQAQRCLALANQTDKVYAKEALTERALELSRSAMQPDGEETPSK